MKLARWFLPVCVLAATALRAQTYTFTNATSFYNSAGGIACDASGVVYVTNYYNHTVVKLVDGAQIQIAGQTYTPDWKDGTGADARFNYPRGIAIDSAGNVYVADTNNHVIRKITAAGVVTTLAGMHGEPGSADGTGRDAHFSSPQGLAIDSAGNIYVADTANSTIRRITPGGTVTTLAGAAGATGTADGQGAAARFDNPQGIAIDASGALFVADTNNHAIRKLTTTGQVTTFAGSPGNRGESDGVGVLARFNSPQGVALDRSGTVFVYDSGNYTIRRITASGVVNTIGGVAGNGGSSNGVGSAARFYGGRAIAVDNTGTLYIADSWGVRLGVSSSQLTFTVGPASATVSAGSTATFATTATGAAPITYQWQKDGSPIIGATTATLTIASVQAGNSGSYSVTATNPVGTVTSGAATLTVLSPLPNDNFANAQAISDASGAVAGSNNGATGEPGEPTHVVSSATASSVWYKWVAPVSGTTVLDFPSTYGTAVAVYTGTALNNLARVAQSNGYRLVFSAQAGTTYWIAVGASYPAGRGSFTLRWRMILNDNFAQAQTLTDPSGQVQGSNDAASGEPNEPNHLIGSSASTTSIWYRWTPTQTGTAVFDTMGTAFQTVIAAYTGTALESLTQVAAGSPTPPIGYVAFNVTAGTTYFIAVGSYGYGTGAITLNWKTSLIPVITNQPRGSTVNAGVAASLTVGAASAMPASYQWYKDDAPIAGATTATYSVPAAKATDTGSYSVVVSNSAGSVTSSPARLNVLVPPANDNFVDAQPLFGLAGSTSGSNTNASGEPGEPIHWNTNGTATSVWYKWAPSTSGLAIVDTVGSTFDTVLAVYTGSSFANLVRVTQDDDRGGGRTSQVTFGATAGTTYWIAIGSGTGGRGALTINWQLSPTLAIATQPVSQTVPVGGSATFKVQATGTGVSYQWMRNGVAIPGATTDTLTLGTIQGGTDASFTVVVTNSSGTVVSSPATLSVSAPTLPTLTQRNSRSGGGLLWSIAGGNGTLVAVGGAGDILSSSDGGKTWVPRISGNTLWLVGVTFGAGQFVIVGEAGTILTSADGVTWTPAPSVGTTERINNVIYADGKFVAVGEHGVILTSVDARTWTVRTSGVRTWLHGLAYNAKIGAFATDGEAGVVLISPDAITWTQLPIDGVKGYLEAVVATDNYAEFVAVGHHEVTGNAVCVSIHQNQLRLKTGETITTWTTEQNPMGTTEGLVGLTTGAGALFATGTSGKIISAKDSRGPWYTIPSGTDGILLSATFYNDSLFVVGEHETILQSDPLFNSRLINISTRGQVGLDANILISGFVINGSAPKKVLVRAAGPTLADVAGLTGVVAKPVLTLIDAKKNIVATNAGWSTSANADAIAATASQLGAFPFARGSADSALLLTLNPGQYTAQVAGAGNTTGLAIVEVYDADGLSNDGPRAINISTRGVTGTGSDVMIAGFVVNGAASRRLLIRGVGPTLAGYGVGGTAAEPQLSLYNAKGVLIATASSWGLQSNADEIRSAAKAVGAFDLIEGSKDSAMLLTLLPGAWTVQVGAANNGSGVALIEVYEVP